MHDYHAPALTSALVFLLVTTISAQDADAVRPPDPKPASKGKWKQLFNGKDLTGWKAKIVGYELGDNFANTFRVEDGVIKVVYDKDKYESFGGRFGHLFYESEFSNYRLRVEYRFVGEQVAGGPGWAFRNSGLMLHGQPAATMGKDQKFPASIEVQLLGGREKGKRTTANLCSPGTNVVMNGKLFKRHCTDSSSETYRGDQWVTLEVEVRDGAFKHIIDGKTVLEYTGAQLDERDGSAKRLIAAGHSKMLLRGTISLQSESHPCEFRKVEIMELPEAGWTDLLAGGDLSKHWHTKGNWVLGKDGVVKLTPRKGERGWSRFDAYLWLGGEYKDFECEFDYMVQKRGNSGFYLHVGDETNPVKKGIEVQIYESHAKGKSARLTDHDSGGIIPGIPPKKNAARPAGEWNRFRIRCRGGKLRVELNGELVNEMSLDHAKIKDRPAAGSIGFQDHSLPLALRRIRIRRL